MEELNKKHDSFKLNKKVTEIDELHRKRIPLRCTDKSFLDEQEIKHTWTKYVTELFSDDRGETTVHIMMQAQK